MFADQRSWRDRVVDAVHEDARDERKAERYRAMIRDWAGEMVRNARATTVTVREKLKRKPYCWTDEQIEEHLRLYDDVIEDGMTNRAENPKVIQYDPMSITTHIGTPLNKKYATLAAIHDASEHCDYPLNPWVETSINWVACFAHWADGSPGPDSVSRDEYREARMAMIYAHLTRVAVDELNDDDRLGIEQMLDDVGTDFQEQFGGESKLAELELAGTPGRVGRIVSSLIDHIVPTLIAGVLLAALLAWLGLG